MGFRYRPPAIKVGNTTIRKNKKGFSISGKSIFGGRKTYNSATGKTTRTYKTGIPGLSYQQVSGGKRKGTGCLAACLGALGVIGLLAAVVALIL